MASSCIVLLAAILLALASVQARGKSMAPSPAMALAPAPAPSAVSGNCTLNGAVALGVCLNLQPGRISPSDKNRCCHRMQGMPRAIDCLCLTFMLAGGPVSANVADGVNSVLGVCHMARIPNLVC